MPSPTLPRRNRDPVTLDQLKAYCRKLGIAVPAGGRREVYEAAITRAAVHYGKPMVDAEIGCFGYHDRDDANCRLCRYRDPCETVALGIERRLYDAMIERLENPRFSFKPMLKSGPPVKRAAKRKPKQ